MSVLEKRQRKLRYIAVTGMLSAVSAVLMMLSFSVPFMPFFIKMDFSEMPALIASFSIGPWAGVTVCLVKNLINLPFTNTGGVGELSNFVLGAVFVATAGVIYRRKKNRKRALLGSVLGAACMAALSLPSNYFVMYPIYGKLMPLDQILGLYQAIAPGVDGLLQCLLFFNVPYTFFKGAADAAVTFWLYKPISRLIHQEGKRSKKDTI